MLCKHSFFLIRRFSTEELTPKAIELNLLPVIARIEFKIFLLTLEYEILREAKHIILTATSSVLKKCSSTCNRLSEPSISRQTTVKCCFAHVVPRLYN